MLLHISASPSSRVCVWTLACSEFALVPGSHRWPKFEYPREVDPASGSHYADIPTMKVFDDVRAGDVLVFNEACVHTGRPNLSTKTRKTLIVNFGREGAGVWRGYRPSPATLQAVSNRQRRVLTNSNPRAWREEPPAVVERPTALL
jgi:ectoine hydroxylase-related dioxygenase (phytanoyl-CoA dioxygenase family)